MKYKFALAVLGLAAIAAGQSGSKALLQNLETANWTHEKGDPDGSESVLLRSDAVSGALELLVRYPAGHVIPPHFHDSNERIVIVEGQLSLRQDGETKVLQAGGFAFLPSHGVQRLSCTSQTRCTFYIFWDGKPNSHPAQ